MAKLQTQFEKFHSAIRVDYDELRDKRGIVLDRIRQYLATNKLPAFKELLQGSYRMKTGVKPIADLDYDIDVGLRFNIDEDDYDAVTVRDWVLNAIEGHTLRTDNKGPCIRVTYRAGYHLDLVCYANWNGDQGDHYALAHKTKGWRPADPPGLLRHVESYRTQFAGTEDSTTKTDQFRRCVRYLRRWNDVRTPREATNKPSGLALVLLASQGGLAPRRFVDERPDDRSALEAFSRTLGLSGGRLVATKPTPEYEDVLGGVSDSAMEDLKSDLFSLAETLREAGADADPVVACEKLAKVFGTDFPVPDPEDTGTKTDAPAIITSSSSA